jgi:hypothetical protein
MPLNASYTGSGIAMDMDETMYALRPPSDRRLTTEEFKPIREELKKMLTNKCKEFLDKLVGINTGVTYDSGKDLMDHVDNTFSSPQAWVFYAPGSTRGRQKFGDLEGVNIGNWVNMKFFPPDQVLRHNQFFASTLLHEIVHTLTKGIDDDLTENVIELGIVPVYQDGSPLPHPKNKGAGSGSDYHLYWSTALKNACFPGLK